MPEKLLIPVNTHRQSVNAVKYALRRRSMGIDTEVCLLHIEPPESHWKVRSPHSRDTSGDIARRQIEHILAQAALPLAAHSVPYAGYLRTGNVIFSILDAAEELDCQQIVVCRLQSGWRQWLHREVISSLTARQRSVPVVAVDTDGMDHSPQTGPERLVAAKQLLA